MTSVSELSSPSPSREPSPPSQRPVPAGARAALARAVSLVADDLAAAEHALADLLHSDIATIPDVAGHLTFAGGKRLRPLVALLGARAAGYDAPHRITVAAVGELLHNATLLHDDVVDGGEFRRGRPAARMVYGNGLAVLTGDFCLSSGLVAIADSEQFAAYRTLAQTVMRMSEGEVAQLCAAGSVPSRERYYDIVDRKTAALIAWCASVGGLVQPEYAAALHAFGTELGYAFQIADDLLDVIAEDGHASAPGTAGVTGKDAGQDLRDGKITLPVALACEADPALATAIGTALAAGPPLAVEDVASFLQRVAATDAPARARSIAQAHAAAAASALDALPPSAARAALVELAGYVVSRDR